MTIVTGSETGGRNIEFLRSSKMISRQSSVSQSSRIYYRSSGAAGFPFTWERLPGEPKQKPVNDGHIVPLPLSPPPASHSLSLPKPSVENYLENKKSTSSPSKLLLLKLWKKMSKKMKKKQSSYSSDVEKTREAFGFDRSGTYYSSPCSASSSSSLSSSSSSTMEDHISNMAGAEQHTGGAMPFARASRSIGRMVVACAPKRI